MFPLSPVQRSYVRSRNPLTPLGGGTGRCLAQIEIVGADEKTLLRSWEQLVARHEMLRLRWSEDGSAAHVLPLGKVTAADTIEVRADEVDDAWHDATTDQGVRARLCRQANDAWKAWLSVDLVVADFMSVEILVRDWLSLCDGTPLPELGSSFAAYAERFAAGPGPRFAQARADWSERLRELGTSRLPFTRDPWEVRNTRLRRRVGALPADVWSRFVAHAREQGLPPGLALLSVAADALRSWARDGGLTITVPLATRPPRFANTVGHFVEPLLAWLPKHHFGRSTTVAERAHAFDQSLRWAVERRAFNSVDALRELAAIGAPLPPPIVMHAPAGLGLRHPMLESFQVFADTPQVVHELQLQTSPEGVTFYAGTIDELFPAGFAEGLIDATCEQATGLAGSSGAWSTRPLCPLPIAHREQRAQANHTTRDLPSRTLVDDFWSRSREAPERPAVMGDPIVSYGELARDTRRLMASLRRAGVQRGSKVGVCGESGSRTYAILLAVLSLGAAYVPLDPKWPAARIKVIRDLAHLDLVVAEREKIVDVPCWVPPDGDEGEAGAVDARPEDLAYVIFTSGTTGAPKGVAIRHRAASNTLQDILERFAVGASDRVLALSSLTFDLSVFDVFGTLAAGGAIVPLPAGEARNPAEWARITQQAGVTIWNSVPQLFALYIDLVEATTQQLPPRLRLAMLSGDWIPVDLPVRTRRIGSGVSLASLGGATEGSIWSVVHDIREIDPDWKSIPYGKPLANQTMHVLDDRLAPMPKGAAGDLYIGGLGLADGYLDDPETTAASFFTHPETGERLYRTGDTARYRDDGVLEFLGRLDDQVKVNGYRIELGEIEATLRRHPDVDDAVLVFVREPEPVLWAYVVGRADPGSASTFEAALKQHCAAALPAYMVPTRIVHLTSFPLSANGKVDRKRLPRPAPDAPAPSPAEASLARTGVGHTLAELWREALGVEPSSASNFYALGGTSLAAIRVSSSAARRGLAFSPDLILRFPVFADCARAWEVSRAQQDEGASRGAWERSIPRVSRDVAPPASFAQQSVWFLEQLHPSMTAYRFQATLHFKGDLSIEALRASLRDIVANHEIYRTTFHWIDRALRQVVHPPFPPDVPLLEPDHPDLRQIVHDEVRRPCDVGTLPLVRWTLVRLGPQEHVLIHAEHHFCHDGWSFYVFVGELMERYRARVAGEAPRLESPRLQFADVAAWQRSWMETEEGHRQLDYWLTALASRPPPIELPLDRPRPSVLSFEGHEHCELIDHELGARLDAFAQTHGATLYMTMLAAFFALLHRYSRQARQARQDDLCIAMPVGNRTSEMRDVMGMLLNMLPLRVDMSGRPTFRELLDRVRKATAEGHAHADVPWSRIVEAMSPVRDSQRLPLFNICFGLQNPPMNRVDLGALELRMDKEHNGSSKFDLSVIASPVCDHLLGRIPVPETRALRMYWEYSTALFEESTIRRMAANYRLLLERATQAPDVPVDELAAETPNGIFGAVTPYERDVTLVDMFQREAERHARSVAIEGDGEPITYGELDARTTQIARWLVERGVRQEARVALCGPRCEEMLVLMLGVLKAGAAYVPVEPTYPRARKALILEDAQVALVLSCGGARCGIDGWPEVDVGEARGEIEAMPTTALRSGASPLSLAYVLYTSGSTGVPRGVMTTHRNVMRLVRNADYAEFGEREVFLHYSPYSFDASTLEIWGPLLNGGRVAVFPREFPTPARLSAFMEERGVTAAWLTAGLFQRFDEPDFARMRGVRQLFVGGDVVSPAQARRAMTALPTTTLIDGYGPTETTTFAVCRTITVDDVKRASIPIGRPVANSSAFILDDALRCVPDGAPGELCLGGDGLARGYLGDPARTAERFVPNPFGEPGSRLYRSGDLVRALGDGALEFLGRRDEQVKVRGFRIELGEVEAMLVAHPAVRRAAVRAWDDQLAAYVVWNGESAWQDLKAFVADQLPEHLVPTRWAVLDELPLTESGKLDRRSLPTGGWAPGDTPENAGPTAPTNPTERAVKAIWQELLHVERFGIHDDFFALGGHSFLAIQLLNRLRTEFDCDLLMLDVFQRRTVAGISAAVTERLAQKASGDPAPKLPPLRRIRRE